MKFYDLFAGIGGFRLGLERAGHQCVGSCEIDKDARKVYGKNFGAEPEASNALKLDAGAMPDFDILAAGFPCQAFSFAGKRLGFADARGTLFHEIARIARQKRPSLLFLENVRGLLSHDESRTIIRMLYILKELGYVPEWQVINGRHFLPQNRERIFIVGHLGEKPTKKVFPLIEDGQAPTERQEEPAAPMVRTITAGGHSGGLHSGMTVIQSGLWQSRGFQTRKDDVSHCLKGQGGSAGNFILQRGRGRNKGGQHDIAPTLSARSWEHNNHVVAVLTPERPTKRQNGRRFEAPTEPMFTLTAQDKHGVSDGQAIRRLTPTECERLQGFPDEWTEGVSDTARYRLLGNAVMPPVIEYIARHF